MHDKPFVDCRELLSSLLSSTFVAVIFSQFSMVALIPLAVGCFTRMERREVIEPPKSVEVISYNEIDEQGREAWYRHLRQTWKPLFALQNESITCENFATAKERLKFKQHPKNAPPLNLEPPLPLEQRHVELEDVCDVFFIYDDDSCRDQPDEDELTQDYPERLHKPLNQFTKSREQTNGNRQEASEAAQKEVFPAENEMEPTYPSILETSLPSARMKL